MSWFNGLQLALACAALVTVVRRMREVAFRQSIDVDVFVSALGPALDHGELALARELAEGCLPAPPAQLVCGALDARSAGSVAVRDRVEELRFDLVRASTTGLAQLQAFARMSGPLAFIGIILELGRTLGQDGSLLSLQRGAVESAGIQASLVTFALGMATAMLCISAFGLLRRRARELRDTLSRVAALLLVKRVAPPGSTAGDM